MTGRACDEIPSDGRAGSLQADGEVVRPDDAIVEWLLEDDNSGVRVRTLMGLRGYPDDHEEVRAARQLVAQTLCAARDLSWMGLKGLTLIYNLTALAESGLTRECVPADPVVDRLLALPFGAACGDIMLLRALVMLGYGGDARVRERLARLAEAQLGDGGWLCLHRLAKTKHTPTSCVKAAMHGLLLAAELKKTGLPLEGSDELVAYFLKATAFLPHR